MVLRRMVKGAPEGPSPFRDRINRSIPGFREMGTFFDRPLGTTGAPGGSTEATGVRGFLASL